MGDARILDIDAMGLSKEDKSSDDFVIKQKEKLKKINNDKKKVNSIEDMLKKYENTFGLKAEEVITMSKSDLKAIKLDKKPGDSNFGYQNSFKVDIEKEQSIKQYIMISLFILTVILIVFTVWYCV